MYIDIIKDYGLFVTLGGAIFTAGGFWVKTIGLDTKIKEYNDKINKRIDELQENKCKEHDNSIQKQKEITNKLLQLAEKNALNIEWLKDGITEIKKKLENV